MAHADKADKQTLFVDIAPEMFEPLLTSPTASLPISACFSVNCRAEITPIVTDVLAIICLTKKPVEFLPSRKRRETCELEACQCHMSRIKINRRDACRRSHEIAQHIAAA